MYRLLAHSTLEEQSGLLKMRFHMDALQAMAMICCVLNGRIEAARINIFYYSVLRIILDDVTQSHLIARSCRYECTRALFFC